MSVIDKRSGLAGEVVEVTPAIAREWLGSSKINRHISDRQVTAYAEAMKRDEWHLTDQGIGFGKDGTLYNGHHRLNAVIKADVTVKMLVVYGLTPESRGVMDGGRQRTLKDRLTMFRDEPNANLVSGYLTLCAALLSGTRIMIRTLDEHDHWMQLFKPGIRWAVDTFSGSKVYKNSIIAGSLAFAHKLDPDGIGVFGIQLRDGTNLSPGDPVLALQRSLMQGLCHNGRGGGDRSDSACKVLNAAATAIRGEKCQKLYESPRGLKMFRAAYDRSRIATALVEPWVGAAATNEPAP